MFSKICKPCLITNLAVLYRRVTTRDSPTATPLRSRREAYMNILSHLIKLFVDSFVQAVMAMAIDHFIIDNLRRSINSSRK